MVMNAKIFSDFRELIYAQSGISLAPGKQTLLQSRIGKRMRALGLDQEQAYLRHITSDSSGEEVIRLLDAVSTNTTYFYREPEHFDQLHEALIRWLRAGQTRLRIWSAASSSGQEPYTIAMTALEVFRELRCSGVDLRILGTDISTRVLKTARQGIYTEQELERVTAERRGRYFKASGKGPTAQFAASDSLRQLVAFRRLNLSQPPFPMKGPLDLIFCRNVMIYFDNQVRARLVADMERLLKPGGLLFIGHSESLIGLGSGLKTLGPSVYQKVEQL